MDVTLVPYEWKVTCNSNICILLGPPGCAQVFPYLSPGPLDLWWYEKTE
jgi:hypothetical protein